MGNVTDTNDKKRKASDIDIKKKISIRDVWQVGNSFDPRTHRNPADIDVLDKYFCKVILKGLEKKKRSIKYTI